MPASSRERRLPSPLVVGLSLEHNVPRRVKEACYVHPLWKFKGQYQDLREAVARGPGEFAFRHLAADLRGLLLDAAPIVDAANQMFRLSVFFSVLPKVEGAGFVACPGGAWLNGSLLAGPPTYKSPGSQVEHVSRDAFLALPAVRLPDRSAFSLSDAVLAGAHLTGAVHGSARGPDGERLKPLAAILFGPGLSAGGELLTAIARHVLEAYQHLFTLSEGASLGLAQPRPERQPFRRSNSAQGDHGIVAMEFAGNEFFEDGVPDGLRSPFAWVGTLALRLQDAGGSGAISPMADRHILDIGPTGSPPGPRFSIIQRGRSILARFVGEGGDVVVTPPVRLMDRRFYAVAAGVAEAGGRVRVFFRVRGGDPRSAFGPPGIGMGTLVPSRMTLGSSLQSTEVKSGRGALMQFRRVVCLASESERDIESCLDNFSRHCLSRRWVASSHPESRASFLYNQARDT